MVHIASVIFYMVLETLNVEVANLSAEFICLLQIGRHCCFCQGQVI